MSIRPVDYQLLLPKVNDVAKIQNSEHQKVMSHVQQQAEQTAKQANQDTRSVHTQKEAQKSVISEKQKGQNKNRGKNKKEGQDKDKASSSKTAAPEIQERHTIDIKL